MNREVNALRSELALLKLQFSKRVEAVEVRLNNLLEQEEVHGDYQNQHQVNVKDQAAEHKLELKLEQEQVTFEAPSPEKTTITPDKNSNPKATLSSSIYSKFPFVAIFFQTVFSALFEWFSPANNMYQSYKNRGMLGIFILTIVGIGLTLAGFGYLMQLLIDQLGAGYKSLLMCLAALSVMGLGIGLKIKTRFSEFATAIVTLGILLSYSTVYFSGSVYTILPDMAVLFLYIGIALLCHILALWLDTKVVAALGIIGIATMPILSGDTHIEPLYYLLSLAFVVGSSLVLAYRHLGPWLAHLSLAFVLISLEWIIGVENIVVSAWLINLFYLLFFTYVAMCLYQEKESTNKHLMFLAALVGSTVLVFLQASNIFSTEISISFALNTVIATAASIIFYKIKRKLSHFFILLTASWAVLTIVSTISDVYWGIAWAVEGLLLLVIGRKFQFPASINQGQILTAIALLYTGSALFIYFPLPALRSVDGWLLSVAIIIIIAIWQRLINTSQLFDELTQKKIKPLLQLTEVVWLSILLIASANIWLGNWAGVFVIILQLALLFRAKHCQQVTIEILAASLILVPLYYVNIGSLLVDSYRFTALPLFAQCALISAFIQLWLWSAFYRKYQPESTVKHYAESVRILFYLLIPVCWLGSVINRFAEASVMILWLSPLLALLLASKVKQPLLIKETKLLTALASVFFAVTVAELPLVNGIIALIGFLIFYGTAYWFNRKESAPIYQFICSWGVLTLGVALPTMLGWQTGELFYGVLFAIIYWSTAFTMLKFSEHLQRNEKFITVVNIILIVISWLLMKSNISFALVPTVFLLSTLYQKEHRFKRTLLSKALKLNGDLFLHSILAVSYVVLCYSLPEYRIELLVSPILAVHGALLLFLKDRRLTTVKYSFVLILLAIIKLAMIDAANALLWQKVMLFMGIGIFILAASFWYQKIVTRVAATNY